MIRLHIVCEGPTESAIVKNILRHHLVTFGVGVTAPMIGTAGKKGGDVTLQRIRENVRDCLLKDRDSYCTTFVDYYGIDSNFPGKKEAASVSQLSDKQSAVCEAFARALAETLDEGPMRRFIPYVQMHEFEALLFSDPGQLALQLRRPDLAPPFRAIRHDFETPEHIDDDPLTAPSKRIQKLFPRYRKVQMGERAAKAITLDRIRAECPLFSAWLDRLENLQPIPA